jgi:hypothetical protein
MGAKLSIRERPVSESPDRALRKRAAGSVIRDQSKGID